MRYLALDVGGKRTGIAYGDSDGTLFSLQTFEGESTEDLLEHVVSLYKDRSIDEVVLGLPLLPDGTEGSQAEFVREFADKLENSSINHSFVDERYSTPKNREIDPDSAAACSILAVKIEQK